MKKSKWIALFGLIFLISSCGKKGDLLYEGESKFPRSYPNGHEGHVAESQHQ